MTDQGRQPDTKYDPLPSISELMRQGLMTPGSPVFELAKESLGNLAKTQTPEEFAGTLASLATFLGTGEQDG